MPTWKLSAHGPKARIEDALARFEAALDPDPDPELVIAARELAANRPEEWVLEGWYPRKPSRALREAFAALFAGDPPTLEIEALEEEDWLAMSQAGAQPIRAGAFHVHTPDFKADPAAIDFTIPAAQAFGTGQHATTAGCLAMLTHMKARGIAVRRIADIGTGTGLLAFAAMRLWPGAEATASDNDPVCSATVAENAERNGIAQGPGPGALTMLIAEGMADPLLEMRGPYDLLIANILAQPLIDLAPDFARATGFGGMIVLSGLLAGEQEAAVVRAYKRAGFMAMGRLQQGDWAVLCLRRRLTGRDRARLMRLA